MEFTTRFGLHSQTTRLREDRTPARRGPLPASHRPRAEPRSEGLRPPSDTGQAVFRTPHFPRPPVGRGFGAGLFPLRSPLLRESCRKERQAWLPERRLTGSGRWAPRRGGAARGEPVPDQPEAEPAPPHPQTIPR
ncbi:translation initiation factor IF-2-like protein [Lates japonicus]|uniref:Translation initiation factor IF-2-like protein n=1 Tax=Lates japonicus TaxID=270547 RepID=A0AAD3MRM9_LATJO|nr:translation initiation factor IF-2-like protein [Lates japonicus]GLD52523.1 translation initiation factor IF-2-like protein [Lates japonicus]GLD52533.1 translation initiation factor IF-2-like protein [Lates japonicus]GLD55508.1 translation initiation factor IF-2-like protein [Lates japonicus]GLD55518.1 translation initiation factor IF-2-like protein [Lates japonicus]